MTDFYMMRLFISWFFYSWLSWSSFDRCFGSSSFARFLFSSEYRSLFSCGSRRFFCEHHSPCLLEHFDLILSDCCRPITRDDNLLFSPSSQQEPDDEYGQGSQDDCTRVPGLDHFIIVYLYRYDRVARHLLLCDRIDIREIDMGTEFFVGMSDSEFFPWIEESCRISCHARIV